MREEGEGDGGSNLLSIASLAFKGKEKSIAWRP